MKKNRKSVIDLIKKYESITIEELERTKKICYTNSDSLNIPYLGKTIMGEITYFGMNGCIPCTKASMLYQETLTIGGGRCVHCCLVINCEKCFEQRTYKNIEHAETIESLYDAIQARVKFIKENLK